MYEWYIMYKPPSNTRFGPARGYSSTPALHLTLDDIAVWARKMVRWARTGTEDGARLSAQVGAPLRQVREDLRERVRLRCGRDSELPDAEADTRAQARLPPRNERA